MNDLKMGFKQSLLQRLHTIEVPSTTGKPCIETKDTSNNANTQITDFSIQRILADNKDEQPVNNNSQDTPPTSPKLYAPVATKPVLASSNDILDLSKNKATENYLNHTLLNPQTNTLNEFPYNPAINYGGFHHNILAAMAAANAQKFYSQFLPHMFTGGFYNAANIARAQPYQKRYFAPYVLNSQAASTNSPQQQQQQQQTPLTPTTPTTATVNASPASNISPPTTSSTLASKLLCSRADCLDCLDSYYKASTSAFPYKSPILSPAASTISSTSSYHGKNQKEILNSLTASNISLTAVTNIHLTTNKSCRDNIMSSSLANNTEEISYKCRICDKVFGCSQTLQAHEKTHKSPRYECTDCGKGFSQLRNYKYHLSVHRGTKEFAAECPECGKTFNDKGYLSSHMKIHRNKKEYECPYCPKSFNQRVAFNMHVRIHTGVKPHKCAECGKRFSRKMLLKQHMRTHSGEKPYQCSVCGKSFADRSNMTLHHRLHSGIKPFNCPICPKAFTKKHHLKTHLNYHTGCKPYVCPHPNCNQAFTQSSNMRTHAKKCQYRPLQMTAYPVAQKSNAVAVSAAATNVTSFSNTSLLTAAASNAAASSSVSNAIATAASQATQNFILNPISRIPSSMAVSIGSSQHHGSLANIVNAVASGNNGNNNGSIPFIPSTTLAAGIRMLSTVTSAVPVTSSSMQSSVFPPAQQPLLSTLRPF